VSRSACWPQTTTDADGVGRCAAPLMRADGPVAPRAIEMLGGEDHTMLDLSGAAFRFVG
jgi:hypothetical protein